METRQYLPEHISPAKRHDLLWFLENFETQYLSCSLWHNDSPWYVPQRRIMDNFFLFPIMPLVVGAGDEKERLIRPGEFFLVPTGRVQWFGQPEGQPFCEHFIMHYNFNSRLFINPVETFQSVFHQLPDHESWYARFRELLCLSSHSQRAAEILGNALMHEFMSKLILNHPEPLAIPSDKTDTRIKKIIRHIEEHFQYDLMIPDLAEKCGLHEVQFRKLFRRHTGMTAKQYLEQCRIRRATELLRRTVDPVRQIAVTAGFNNQYYFCAVFKRYTGMTPSEYRRHLFG